MNMRVITFDKAQQQFDQLIEDAKEEPIAIFKDGCNEVVVLSLEKYDKLIQPDEVKPLVREAMKRNLKKRSKLYEALAK